MVKAAKFLKINVALFLVAAGVSAYLLWQHYELINGEAAFNSFCSVSAKVDCDSVNSSVYSEFLGIPLAAWGLGYYLFALMLSFTGARNAFTRRDATLLLFPFVIVSVIVSFVSLYLMLGVLKTFCLMCGTLDAIHVVTLVTTALAVRDVTAQSSYGAEWKQVQMNRVFTFLGIGAVLLLGVHFVSAQFERQFPFDEEVFVASFRAQPVMPVEAGDSPKMGYQGENPPVQLIEFADFECPACAMAAKKMHHLLREYKDRVQVVFKHFPWDSSCNPHIERGFHPRACLAAKASHCAHKQGQFKPMYEQLFENQKAISTENIAAWVEKIGLNKAEFEACMSSPQTTTEIQKDIDQAKTAGVQSTPTFFANGKKVEGLIDENRLKAILKELGK